MIINRLLLKGEYFTKYRRCLSHYLFVGIKKPTVQCEEIGSSKIVDNALCTDTIPKPGDLQCNEGECPATYSFRVFYGACSVTCGTGKRISGL